MVGGDTLFVELLAAMLELRRGVRIVFSGPVPSGGASAAGKCEPGVPDLIVADLDSLDEPSSHWIETCLSQAPPPRMLLITPPTSKKGMPRWLGGGNQPVVSRQDRFDHVLARLEDLFQDRLAMPRPQDDSARHKPLTARESEVVVLMGEGLTTPQIAAVLGRSVFTIQTHRKRIAEKLGRLGGSLAQRVVSHRDRYFTAQGPDR